MDRKPLESRFPRIAEYGATFAPLEMVGRTFPGYRKTHRFRKAFVNDYHRLLGECPMDGELIDLGIPGWLRREDALKLYELGYFARKPILELGCCQGLSTSILARAVRDAGRGTPIDTVDLNPRCVEIAASHLRQRGLDNGVTFHCAEAAEFCRRLVDAGARFSLIFIDHSHDYQHVLPVCQTFDRLVGDDGLCLFHDYNDPRNPDPREPEYGVYQAVHEGLSPESFEFCGIFGCTGLFRHRPAHSTRLGRLWRRMAG